MTEYIYIYIYIYHDTNHYTSEGSNFQNKAIHVLNIDFVLISFVAVLRRKLPTVSGVLIQGGPKGGIRYIVYILYTYFCPTLYKGCSHINNESVQHHFDFVSPEKFTKHSTFNVHCHTATSHTVLSLRRLSASSPTPFPKRQISVLLHSSYSPDLLACQFFIFI